MKLTFGGKSRSLNIAMTGLMAALVLVATMFLKIQIPVGLGTPTMVGFANVFCILSGLLLGPLYGGVAAGLGSALADVMNPAYLLSAPVTLITKFLMAWVCGLIAHSASGKPQRLGRLVAAAVSGSLCYCVLYLAYTVVSQLLLGSAMGAILPILSVKAVATLINAVIADIIAVPLFLSLRAALFRGHKSENVTDTHL